MGSSLDTTEAGGQWNIFKDVLREKNGQARVLYLMKITLGNYSDIRTLPEKGKLREFVVRIPALQEMLTVFQSD